MANENRKNLMDAIEEVIRKYGGLQRAARAVKIEPAHLCRMRQGKVQNPTQKTLRKLGLKRKSYIVNYWD